MTVAASGSGLRRFGGLLLCGALLSLSPLWAPGPAHASACTGGDGVTVVVDFGPYGGVQTGCAPDPTSGLSALSQAGFSVALVSGQAFVCRINGAPPPEQDACQRTPPESAYWSYWQAPPGGDWRYSNLGATSTSPGDGASEGWAFGSGAPPGIAPPVNTAAPPPPPTRPPPPASPPPAATPPGSAPRPPRPPPAGPASTTPQRPGNSPGGTVPPAASGTVPPAASGSAAPTSPGTPAATTITVRPDVSETGSPPSSAAAANATAAATGNGNGPSGVLVAGLVVAALAGGAYWQTRQRR